MAQPRDPWLAVAVSARALAAAVRRDGSGVIALDRFADADTRALACTARRLPPGVHDAAFDGQALLGAAGTPEWRRLPLVYGAGFEDRPDLLARLAEGRDLVGNRPDVLAAIKDPEGWSRLLGRLGIPHPAVAATLGDEAAGWPAGWLVKRRGGSGGGHIGRADAGTAPPGHYFQREAPGHAVSALFLADGRRARILGFTEQWSAPGPGCPFRYGGAAGPVDPQGAAALAEAIGAVTDAAGLVGLNSADFLIGDDGFVLLEVNPRPGATLDLFDRPPLPPLFGLHRDACRGRLPATLPAPIPAAAALVYAGRDLILPALRWPAWTADRPDPGTLIAAGEPVCTVTATAETAAAARRLAASRVCRMEAAATGKDAHAHAYG